MTLNTSLWIPAGDLIVSVNVCRKTWDRNTGVCLTAAAGEPSLLVSTESLSLDAHVKFLVSVLLDVQTYLQTNVSQNEPEL